MDSGPTEGNLPPVFVLVTLAAFWAWEFALVLLKTFVPSTWIGLVSLCYPAIALILPLVVLWPNWLAATAVASMVGILHLLVEKIGDIEVSPIQFRRNRRTGLPPLP